MILFIRVRNSSDCLTYISTINTLVTFGFDEAIELHWLNVFKFDFESAELVHFVVDSGSKITIIHHILHQFFENNELALRIILGLSVGLLTI